MDLSPHLSRESPVPSIDIVLTDGFSGEDVIVTVGGAQHRFQGVRTQLLTGLAEQRTFSPEEDAPLVVTARLEPGEAATPPLVVAPGSTVVVALADTGLSVTVHDGPLGFA